MAFNRLGWLAVGIAGATVLLACSGTDGGPGFGTGTGCPSGLSLCGGECVSLQTSGDHCGTCGHACSANEVCSEGTCAGSCGVGLTQCGQSCVDLASDVQHCGDCNLPCDGTCGGGTCMPAAVGGSGGGTAGSGGSEVGGSGGSEVGGSGGSESGGSGGTSAGGSGGNPSTCTGVGALYAELTDPSCTDGKYCEALPNLSVNIGGWVNQLEPEPPASQATPIALELLDAAWPFASTILRYDLSCANEYTAYGYGWYNNIQLAVHECGHMYDFMDGFAYHMSSNSNLAMPNNDYFPRDEIFGDAYQNAIPSNAYPNDYFAPGGTTSYQGIQTMYDEWSQYVHSVALGYLLYSEYPEDWDMQFMLHFAWAAPRYFLWAETHHPGDFADMMADSGVREATLALWGQTMLYFDAYRTNNGWTPDQEQNRYLDAIRHPDLLAMMNRIRQAHGCPGI